MRITILLAASLAVLLSGCGIAQPDRCESTARPDECRAWGSAGGDVSDYLVGGMAGYMLASRGGQTVVVRDAGYRGAYRPLHHALVSENMQLRQKIERQRVELGRQQAANARKSATIRAFASSPARKTAPAASTRSWSSPSGYRPSSYRSGRK